MVACTKREQISFSFPAEYQLHSEDEVVTFRSEHDAFHCLWYVWRITSRELDRTFSKWPPIKGQKIFGKIWFCTIYRLCVHLGFFNRRGMYRDKEEKKKSLPSVTHIKLFPQCDEHLFSSVPGVRNHLPHIMRMLSVTNFQNGGQVKEGN